MTIPDILQRSFKALKSAQKRYVPVFTVFFLKMLKHITREVYYFISSGNVTNDMQANLEECVYYGLYEYC